MTNIWFTSDLHIGHQKVIDFCNRPYASLEEMHSDIVRRWNAKVGPDDIGYFLGDIFWQNPNRFADLIPSMNGYKVCIKGNHDPSPQKLLDFGFHRVHEQDFVKIHNTVLWLAHIPTHNESDKRGLERPKPIIKNYDVALCGHVHCAWKVSPLGDNVNVGVDVWGMDPVNLDDILLAYQSKKFELGREKSL